MTKSILTVEGLSKKFARDLRGSLRGGWTDLAREFWPRSDGRPRLRPGEFWAVDELSFDLKEGEALAIIGHNGAGKSTLLRILHGLIKPDGGKAIVRGRTEAILDLGAGFNPLLSGRENVQLSAAIHGIDKAAASRLADEVADFAELGDLFDAPLQSYSSGMRARLGYALSAQLQPDLLLVDEVLAVGDFAFQRKCLNHMRSYIEKGGALLFVSHHVHQIQRICNRGIVLDHGRLLFDGSATDALDRMLELSAPILHAGHQDPPEAPVVIRDACVEPVDANALEPGGSFRLRVQYEAFGRTEVRWGFTIWTSDQWTCLGGDWDPTRRVLEAGPGELCCEVPSLPLAGGRYILKAVIADFETGLPLTTDENHRYATQLNVKKPATALANAKAAMNHLITLDVVWP